MNPPTTGARSVPRCLRGARALIGTATAMAAGAAYALPVPLGAHEPGVPDIRDIRPPFHFSAQWWWLVGIGAGLVLAALAVVVWRWRHRRSRDGRLEAHELALLRLREARALMSPAQAREFSIAVSGIIRTYIEQRFDMAAAHRTTPEFLGDCSKDTTVLQRPQRETLEVFLRHCDLAKFARWVLSVPEMQDLLASAVDFVTATAPSTPSARGHTEPSAVGAPASAPEVATS